MAEQNGKIDRELHEFMSEDPLSNLRDILDSYKKKMDALDTSEN